MEQACRENNHGRLEGIICFNAAPTTLNFAHQLEGAIETHILPSKGCTNKAVRSIGRSMGIRGDAIGITAVLKNLRWCSKNVIQELEKKDNSAFVGIYGPEDKIRYVTLSPRVKLLPFQIADAILTESHRCGTYLAIKKCVDFKNELDVLLPPNMVISSQIKNILRTEGGFALFDSDDAAVPMKLEDVLGNRKFVNCRSGRPAEIYDWSLLQIGQAIVNDKVIVYGEGLESHKIPDLMSLVEKHQLLNLWNVGGIFGSAKIPGVTEPMIYCGSTLTAFGAQMEDINVPRVIQVLRGQKILGLIEPGDDVERFLSWVSLSMPLLECGSPLQHRSLLPERKYLEERKLNCTFHSVTTGETFFIPPGHIHFSVDVGHTISISVNVGSTSWFQRLPNWITQQETDTNKVLSEKHHIHPGFEKSYKSCPTCKTKFRNILSGLNLPNMKGAAHRIPHYNATFIYGKIKRGAAKYSSKCEAPFETQEVVPAWDDATLQDC